MPIGTKSLVDFSLGTFCPKCEAASLSVTLENRVKRSKVMPVRILLKLRSRQDVNRIDITDP
jgi:hypothetical protein